MLQKVWKEVCGRSLLENSIFKLEEKGEVTIQCEHIIRSNHFCLRYFSLMNTPLRTAVAQIKQNNLVFSKPRNTILSHLLASVEKEDNLNVNEEIPYISFQM